MNWEHGPTRRQSQRRDLSRLVRWNVLSKWNYGSETMMRHEARQVPSWLIFDVSRRKIAMRSSLENAVGSGAARVVRFAGRAREYEFRKRRFVMAGFWVLSRR